MTVCPACYRIRMLLEERSKGQTAELTSRRQSLRRSPAPPPEDRAPPGSACPRRENPPRRESLPWVWLSVRDHLFSSLRARPSLARPASLSGSPGHKPFGWHALPGRKQPPRPRRRFLQVAPVCPRAVLRHRPFPLLSCSSGPCS